MIIVVIEATFTVAKKMSLKKIQACTRFEPLTSAILVQRSTTLNQKANWEQVVELVR